MSEWDKLTGAEEEAMEEQSRVIRAKIDDMSDRYCASVDIWGNPVA